MRIMTYLVRKGQWTLCTQPTCLRWRPSGPCRHAPALAAVPISELWRFSRILSRWARRPLDLRQSPSDSELPDQSAWLLDSRERDGRRRRAGNIGNYAFIKEDSRAQTRNRGRETDFIREPDELKMRIDGVKEMAMGLGGRGGSDLRFPASRHKRIHRVPNLAALPLCLHIFLYIEISGAFQIDSLEFSS
jgi:hypothetical protein